MNLPSIGNISVVSVEGQCTNLHRILQTMGEHELSGNEKFVCCFAGFLTEALRNLKFEEE